MEISDDLQKQHRCNDGSYEEIGTSNMHVFIMLNGPPAGYKNTRKCLKTALIEKYGKSYFLHFKHVSSDSKFKFLVTSKVVNKIIEEPGNCLPCFQ